MDYEGVLRLAGAKVLCYKRFGSWQGDWLAKVQYDSKTFWVHGYYGSCTQCDAVDAIEAYSKDKRTDFKELGQDYLDDPRDWKQLMRQAIEDSEWDSHSGAMVDFLKEWGE